MKTYIIVVVLFFGFNISILSQSKFISKEVKEISERYESQDFSSTILQDKNYRNNNVSAYLTKSIIYDYDKTKATDLISKQPEYISLKIQNDVGEEMTLDLVKNHSVLSSLSVTTGNDQNYDTSNFKAVFYRGVIKGQEESLVSISFFENEMSGFISNHEGNYVIGKLENSNKLILYNDKNLNTDLSFHCGTEDTPLSNEDIDIYQNANNLIENSTMASRCVGLYFETEYDIFQNKGSVSNVLMYVASLYNQVSTLYFNDGISTVLAHVKVWDVEDPYTGNTQDTLLSQFEYRASIYGISSGTVGQLLTFRYMGGKAKLSPPLCTTRPEGRVSVAGGLGSFSSIPTYSWSVNVTAHELGHLLGSRHTHACVWNGNNTAIDGCGPQAGYSEGCNGPIPQDGGTIMSYCHLNVGINFSKGFGIQPRNVIINNINKASNSHCTMSCNTCPISLNITSNINGVTHEQASSYIIATNTINSGAAAFYRAGDEIYLKPGFNAKLGSSFSASIEDCNGNSNKISVPENTKTLNTHIPDSPEVNNNLSISPNPASTYFKISGGIEKLISWKLYDMSGKMIKSGNSNTVDVQSIPNASYILNINLEKTQISKTIIVKH